MAWRMWNPQWSQDPDDSDSACRIPPDPEWNSVGCKVSRHTVSEVWIMGYLVILIRYDVLTTCQSKNNSKN